jgi:signal transduction histidine kinase
MSGKPVYGRLEISVICKNGTEAIIELFGTVSRTGNMPTDIVYIRDITNQRKTAAELEDSERRYRSLFEHAPVALWEINYSNLKTYFDMLGYKSVKDLSRYIDTHLNELLDVLRNDYPIHINQATMDLYEASKNTNWNELTKESMEKEKDVLKLYKRIYSAISKRRTSFQTEGTIMTFGGNKKNVQIKYTIPPGYEDTWSRVFVSEFDTTRIKQQEKRLKAYGLKIRHLAHKMMNIQEEERKLIARELHDLMSQELIIIRREIISLDADLTRGEISKRVVKLIGLTDKLLDNVHSLSVRLRPTMLDELGLEKAIQWYLEEFEIRSDISCRFRSRIGTVDEKSIGKEISTTAYRIFQEAMSNILRHSKAKKVNIGISATKGKLIVSIADDGIGFDIGKTKDKTSLGLLGMKERAYMVGGDVRISTNPGSGTKVTAFFPLVLSKG